VSDRAARGDSHLAPAASVETLAAELERAWEQLRHGAQGAQLAPLQESTRALIAAAESDGYPKVAELASIIDVMLAPVVQDEEPFTAEFQQIVRDYLRALRRLSRQPSTKPIERPIPPPAENDAREAPIVLLLEPNATLARDLQMQIGHFGYDVRTACDVPNLLTVLDMETPHAIMAAAPLEQLTELAQEIRKRISGKLPLIVLAENSDLESRLIAARAGADAYLVKPFDLHELVDQLDRLGAHVPQEPYHIVVVEDSTTQATYYSAILNKAGMVTTVVNDPIQVLDVMNENAADLVLMDMYMPRCNGMELARVIRQVPRYASIPIVYLSAETEIDRQLDAMSLGGDDFLTKPINPTHLIRSVAIRAERARSLRSFMVTDNLTGLLNHTRIKEQLHNEVARAARNGGKVSFAMIDIDHFKSVNDTHGHHVGDRVIKTLARVLQQRLRQTDYIGRYGGEEFAVILPDADLAEACQILDQLREGFAKIRQLSRSGVFAVTFSGGVASFPASGDAVKLALNADQALYAAKRAGRNRIIPYSPDLA